MRRRRSGARRPHVAGVDEVDVDDDVIFFHFSDEESGYVGSRNVLANSNKKRNKSSPLSCCKTVLHPGATPRMTGLHAGQIDKS